MRKLFKKILVCILACSVFCSILVGCNTGAGGSAGSGGGSQNGENKDYMYYGRYQKVEDSGVNFVQDGASSYSILLRDGYDLAEGYAAEEFNRLLEEVSGVTLPIVTQADISSNTKYISIGKTAMSDAAGISPTLKDYTRNGFHIKSYGDGLVINASQRSGLIYGVYRFFEKNCNYMYYDYDTMVIDHSKTVELKNFDFQDWPDFLNRDVHSYENNHNPERVMRLYNTGGQFNSWGDKYGEGDWWSSLNDESLLTQLLKWGTYRDEHPEWYLQSEKQYTETQLCYTEVLAQKDTFEKGDFSEENYDAGHHGAFWTLVYNLITKYIAVETTKSLFMLGMMDNDLWCECDGCTTGAEKYEKSGVTIRLFNEVAKEVKKWQNENCPEREIYLVVFAYQSLTIPPVKLVNGEYQPIDETVRVEDNIVVRYAPANDNALFPWLDAEYNPGTTEALLGWSSIAKNLAVWDYRIQYITMVFPAPNWLSRYENIQIYKQLGFIDIMHQGPSQFDGLPLLSMDTWVRSRLLWDTNLDPDALMDEFISVYYGPAAPIMHEYLDYLTVHHMTHLKDLNVWSNLVSGTQYIRTETFPLGVVNNMEYIFNKMYAAIEPVRASDPEAYKTLKRHVDTDSTLYRYTQLALYRSYFDSQDAMARIDELERITQEVGFRDLYTVWIPWKDVFSGWRDEISKRSN